MFTHVWHRNVLSKVAQQLNKIIIIYICYLYHCYVISIMQYTFVKVFVFLVFGINSFTYNKLWGFSCELEIGANSNNYKSIICKLSSQSFAATIHIMIHPWTLSGTHRNMVP